MEKKPIKENNTESTVKAAVISGVATIATACIGAVGTIIAALPAVQELSIPTEVLTFIGIVMSIILVSAVLIVAITAYIRNQNSIANTANTKLMDKEKDLFLEIENETTTLIAEKV